MDLFTPEILDYTLYYNNILTLIYRVMKNLNDKYFFFFVQKNN